MSEKFLDDKNKVLQAGEHYVTSDYKSRNNDRQHHKGIDLVGINKYADYVVECDGKEIGEALEAVRLQIGK